MQSFKVLLFSGLLVFNLVCMATPTTVKSAKISFNELNPEQSARKIMDIIIERLKGKQDFYRKNPNELTKVSISLVEEISPYLDMPRMSWSIVGKVWRTSTKNEKRAFIAEFKKLVINSYVNSFLNYVGKEFEYLPYRVIPNKKNAVIRSFTISKGKKLPIVYRFYNSKKRGWRVYDVAVVGVSLVRTYKSSYTRTIRQSKLAGLTKILKEKNDKSLNF